MHYEPVLILIAIIVALAALGAVLIAPPPDAGLRGLAIVLASAWILDAMARYLRVAVYDGSAVEALAASLCLLAGAYQRRSAAAADPPARCRLVKPRR